MPTITRRWLFAVLLLAALLLLPVIPHATRAQTGGDPITVQVDYQNTTMGGADVIAVAGKDVATVTITLNAPADACPAVERKTPVDVVLVIDVSASMDEAAGSVSKIDATKAAALSFISQLNLVGGETSDQAAIVAYSDDGQLVQELTSDRTLLESAINSLSTISGTQPETGMTLAIDQLAGPRHNALGGALPVIILLSDGLFDVGPVEDQAERAKDILPLNNKIATIGLGDDVDQDALRQVADSGLAYFASDAATLTDVYNKIALEIQTFVNAQDLTITYTYDRDNYELQDGSIQPPGASSVAGNQIVWTWSELNAGDTETFSFDVRATHNSTVAVGNLLITYTPCEQEGTVSQATFSGPMITAQIPTNTPGPTMTPTSTITPTATATGTPLAPNAIMPGPGGEIDAPGVTSDYCPDGWWDWARWVLVGLALLIVVVILLLMARRRLADGSFGTPRGFFCFLVRATFMLYLVGLLWLFTPALFGSQCELPESVYFRRMDSNTSGVFLTHKDLDSPAQVKALNDNGGCLGCHTVSDDAEMIAAVAGPPQPNRLRIASFEGELVDIPEINEVMYLAFSPDGERLAYSTRTGDIYILTLDTGVFEPLIGAADTAFAELMPAWSPDGRTIAFVRAPLESMRQGESSGLIIDGPCDIYIVDAGGGIAAPLSGASGDGLNYYPAYSPDGKWLAFTYNSAGTTYNDPAAQIALVPAPGGTRQFIEGPISEDGRPAGDAWPRWSKDSRQLAFQTTSTDANYDVVIVSIDASGMAGEPQTLAGASEPGVHEYLPYWGDPMEPEGIWGEWKPLLPWLLGLPIFALLMLLCRFMPRRQAKVIDDGEQPRPAARQVGELGPIPFEPWTGIDVLWEPQPALVIGLGRAGRWTLTHLKKTLLDANLGEAPQNVSLLCLAAGDSARLSQTDMTSVIQVGGVELERHEVLEWRDNLQTLVRNAEGDRALRGWIRRDYLESMGQAGQDPRMGLQGRRALGRLAVLGNLRGDNRETGVALWDVLQAVAQKAITPDRRLTILLVSDLSDDVGSGGFLDVAYLLRRLEEKLRLSGIRVVGHLYTDKIRGGDFRQQVNTAAAMRELARFQLAAGWPFPMHYAQSAQQPTELDGGVNKLLFDELYVYDGENQPRRLNQIPPERGIYPVIADSIAVWLDAAARQGRLSQMRDTMIGETLQQQLYRNQLMFGSMGLYQFRLPFADLIEDITVRYARQVLQQLLMGDSTEKPDLNPARSRERFVPAAEQSPRMLAGAFMVEQFAPSPQLSQEWRLVFQRFGDSDDSNLARALGKLRVNTEHDQAVLQRWLQQALLIILNGQAPPQGEQPDYQLSRSAKLGLALGFLAELVGDDGRGGILARVVQRVRNIEGPDSAAGKELASWALYAIELQRILHSIAAALGVPPAQDTLYQMLAQREGWLSRREQDLANLVTRQYIWKDRDGRPLREVWYEQYLVNHIPEGLGAIFWVADGWQIKLAIKKPQIENQNGGEIVPFDPRDIYSFGAAMLEVGRYFARKVRTEETLAGVLRSNLLHPDNLKTTAMELFDRSGAGLGVREDWARVMSTSLVLSANPNVSEIEQIRKTLSERLHNPSNLLVLRTTDPYSLTLVKMIDTVPLDAVPTLNADFEQYMRETGLSGESFQSESAMNVSLFEAEETALAYERQLPKLRQQTRLFNPVTVTLLADRIKAEVFLLALASGQEATYKHGIRFNTPEWAGELVSRDEGEANPIVLGLLRFQTAISDEAALTIRDRYLRDDVYIDAWDEWEQSGYQEWLNTAKTDRDRDVINDLIAITRLLIRSLL